MLVQWHYGEFGFYAGTMLPYRNSRWGCCQHSLWHYVFFQIRQLQYLLMTITIVSYLQRLRVSLNHLLLLMFGLTVDTYVCGDLPSLPLKAIAKIVSPSMDF